METKANRPHSTIHYPSTGRPEDVSKEESSTSNFIEFISPQLRSTEGMSADSQQVPPTYTLREGTMSRIQVDTSKPYRISFRGKIVDE